ncbi:S41 family peptidase [uncultured Enterococcus sp.]|uniref:S41 family peptidase n=1 Tax=uncultured Enterococcus sp. TaxID=167972 RepID=UPI002625F3C2|nr:S41 family peptidase [uncultured Enterococcus sp.]
MKLSKKQIMTIGITAIISATISGSVVYYFENRQTDEQFAKVAQVYQGVQDQYYEKVDRHKLAQGAIKGMLDSLDDPYTTLLDDEQKTALNDKLSSQIVGIGAVVSFIDNQVTIVEEPKEGTPANKAGLAKGDIIEKVDEKAVKDLSLDEVVSLIKGKANTVVHLQLKRGNQVFQKAITRKPVHLSTVKSQIDQNNPQIALIHIETFGEQTAQDLQNEIMQLRKDRVTSFILDLRQNGGGLLDEGEKVASMFLKDGQIIVQFAEKNQITQVDKANKKLDHGFKVTEDVVVLVDGQTASAAELVAAALKESAHIPVVGQKTFGKGTVQLVTSLDKQSEMKLSTQKWLTPKKNWVHKKGLVPDILIALPTAQQLNTFNNQLNNQEELSESQKKDIQELFDFLGIHIDLKNYDSSYQAALKEIQTNEKLKVTGQLDQETLEKVNALIFSKYLKEDLSYQKALEQLKEEK